MQDRRTWSNILLMIFLSLVIFSLFSRAEYDTEHNSISAKLMLLQNQLELISESATHQDLDWKNALRRQRAVDYLESSRRYRAANWNAQALDHAQRGLRLVDLYKQHARNTM